jgi:asparagine synthase (glutamine-hydrolysing)
VIYHSYESPNSADLPLTRRQSLAKLATFLHAVDAMCGICGFLGPSPDAPPSEAPVRAMARALAHRGPDNEGLTSDGPMVLGHRRLSIIDLSPSGHQPMANEDGSVLAVVNGELYNFQDLRRRLQASGHRFRSQSDSEVLVHLYEERGDDLLADLRGMFAFAVWDARRKRLLLARDRLGKKPLFWAAFRQGFAFSSEIASLLCGLPFRPEADPQAILRYLTLQYVPAPMSAFSGTAKLPAGHLLTVTPGQMPEVRRYWRLSFAPRDGAPKTLPEAAEALAPMLEEAVRIRQIADVPLGAFLSGGIDSSLVVAMMAKASPRPVETFSIDFAGSAGEAIWARKVAKMWNTEHHELEVKPDMVTILPELVRRYGEPFADTSAVPVYYLAKLTRANVVVALSGDGGDEVFGGYRRYLWDKLARHIAGLGLAGRAVGGILARLPGAGLHTVRAFGKAAFAPMADRYLPLIAHFSPAEKKTLLAPAFRDRLGQPVASPDPVVAWFAGMLAESTAQDDVNRLLDLDTRSYLPDDILVKVDIASMAHALEVRAPLLDHVLVEWMAGLPGHLKLKLLRGKRLLRTVARGLVPDQILTRKKKGFSMPVDHWFREELRPMAHDLLLGPDARTRAYVEGEPVRRLLAEQDRGAHHGEKLWNLVVLELWLREPRGEAVP